MSDSSAGPLEQAFGPARRGERPVRHERPGFASDALVSAMGKLGEALEAMEDARGHLYAFHRLSGRADLVLQEAVAGLRDAGEPALAGDLDRTLVGRDVVPGY